MPCNMALWQRYKLLYLVQIVVFTDIVSTNLIIGKGNMNTYCD